MKVNFDKIVTNLDGSEIIDVGVPVNLKQVMVNLLLMSYKDEETLSGAEKFKRGELARKVFYGEDFTVDELADIKKIIGKGGSSLVVWHVYSIIDKVE